MLPSAPAPGQQLAFAGSAGVSVAQPGQPLHETDAGTAFTRLAGAVGSPPGLGGNLHRSAEVSGDGLQGERMVSPGAHGWLETRCLRLLHQARCPQTDLGAGTGQESLCQIAGGTTAARVW